jgi:hypothetical protein
MKKEFDLVEHGHEIFSLPGPSYQSLELRVAGIEQLLSK